MSMSTVPSGAESDFTATRRPSSSTRTMSKEVTPAGTTNDTGAEPVRGVSREPRGSDGQCIRHWQVSKVTGAPPQGKVAGAQVQPSSHAVQSSTQRLSAHNREPQSASLPQTAPAPSPATFAGRQTGSGSPSGAARSEQVSPAPHSCAS